MARTLAKVRGAEAATVVTRRSNRSTATPTRFAYPTSERMSRARSGETLEQCVLRSLDQYFTDLDGSRPHALYEMVIHAVERPLLEFAMARADGNQCVAAELLGINRNTLRKKLQQYRLL